MPWSRVPLLAVALAVVTIAIYAPARHFGFVGYDDPEYVTANPMVMRGFTGDGVRWALTATQPHNWHPLTWLSHMLDVQLYGMDAGQHHLVNVLLHALNAALLFALLDRMTGAAGRSLVVAALFALHPLHVESVAWVAERKDVLSTACWMIAVWAYVVWTERGGPWRYALVVIAFALGLMSKPMVVTLPFVLLLIDWWPLRRVSVGATWRPLIVEKAPLFALAASEAAVTVLAQHGQAMSSLASVPLTLRLANAVTAYAAYLERTVWPLDLAVFYPLRATVSPWRLAGSMLLLAAISWVALRRPRDRPYLLVGWLWFLGVLVPVSGIAQAGLQASADRFTYVPLIGIFVMMAWGMPELLVRVPGRERILAVGAAAAVIACAFVTAAQLRHWRDSEALFRHALAVTDGNFLAHNNLGEALLEQGRVDEAAAHFMESIRLEPRFPHARVNLAGVLLGAGRLDEAIAAYGELLWLAPGDADVERNLGLALYQRGDWPGAIEHLTAALVARPEDARAHNNLAAALEKRGDLDAAITHYAEAVRLDPTYERARKNLEAARARRPAAPTGRVE